MTTLAVQNTCEKIQGVVERITYHSAETGFAVLRVKVNKIRDLVTVIGNVTMINAGEYVNCEGVWINDKKHGLQFKSSVLKTVAPNTREGIEKYLASGLIKGVGPHFAKKLVAQFGADVLEIIDNEPEKLLTLEGIGKKRLTQIISAWDEQKVIREIMIFLQSYGIGSARAVRIFKTYGKKSIDIVRENPYRLAADIRGIGFKSADTIAINLGIAKDSLIRAQAGIKHVLYELCDKGHVAAITQNLINNSHKLLDIPLPIIEQALKIEITEGNLIEDYINDEQIIYPLSLYRAEVRVAKNIKRLNTDEAPFANIEINKAIDWVQEKNKITLSHSQISALELIIKSKVSIITGGPGVGKTTLVNSFLKIIQKKHLSIALCAPTGRAAKRLTETTGIVAKTIHRLLEFQPKNYAFKYNENNPLPLQVLIVDESSMIDLLLLNHLLSALPSYCALIFVGDIDQLPSVGSGAVLHDMIASNTITTVRLTEIFRQAKNSNIILNAHRINSGQMPLPNADAKSDFFTIYADDSQEIMDKLLEVVTTRLPKFYQCNPISDIQILTPMNRGTLGSKNINSLIQEKLNGNSGPKITKYGVTFAPNDKVIQMTNNYDKDVFNGDIGFIHSVNIEEGIVKIYFEEKLKEYETHELDELSLAYAISIHKSQGSEFPIIVIPVATEHFTLLARNLIYTAITRGKKLVVLIGQKKAIAIAVHNNKDNERITRLQGRLQN